MFLSEALRDWLIQEWELCLDFKLSVMHHDRQKLATAMLEELYSQLENNCDRDSRIEFQISPTIRLAVGVNVYSWTIWAFISNTQLQFSHHTPNDREFNLTVCGS